MFLGISKNISPRKECGSKRFSFLVTGKYLFPTTVYHHETLLPSGLEGLDIPLPNFVYRGRCLLEKEKIDDQIRPVFL
jgi:hypothetical protein